MQGRALTVIMWKARHRASLYPRISTVCYNCEKEGTFGPSVEPNSKPNLPKTPTKEMGNYLEGARFRLWKLIRRSREPTGSSRLGPSQAGPWR